LKAFKEFAKSSGVPGLGALVHSGLHWKSIEVRSNRLGDAALGITFDSDGASPVSFPFATLEFVIISFHIGMHRRTEAKMH
jgi:hypothetical protein